MDAIILRSLDGLEKVISPVDVNRLGYTYVMPILKPTSVSSGQFTLHPYSVTNRKYTFQGEFSKIGTSAVRIYLEEWENEEVPKSCNHQWSTYHGLSTIETICTLCNEKKHE